LPTGSGNKRHHTILYTHFSPKTALVLPTKRLNIKQCTQKHAFFCIDVVLFCFVFVFVIASLWRTPAKGCERTICVQNFIHVCVRVPQRKTVCSCQDEFSEKAREQQQQKQQPEKLIFSIFFFCIHKNKKCVFLLQLF
jgi:hypothetical protein